MTDELRRETRFHATDWRTEEGTPFPLGVQWIEAEQAFNFALYSKHAEQVELLLFRDEEFHAPCHVFRFNPLRNKSGPIWHCRLQQLAIGGASYYAYRVDGPPPTTGFSLHQFDREKLLLDPYARGVFFPSGFDREVARRPGTNIGRAPLGVLRPMECAFDWEDDAAPRHGSDLVVYEMHVRGFTRHPNSNVPAEKRGTFAGVTEKIPYLKELGVTALELMPVFQFDPGERNYWGYMPLNFFSPHSGYSVNPQRCAQDGEFREMVKQLHRAGIEVILDVVYNHTCEGDESGPVYSFKGIDTSTYYFLTGDQHQPYANFSGTGNTMHTANRAVRQLIVDSLRYWVREMHVDGFRFDLASIFARNREGHIEPEDPPIFAQIASDPHLADVRLIAEPWDAAGVYQLGRKFPGVQWMQWNAVFRDTLQRFVRGDKGMVPDLMTRLYGSSDLFPDDRFHALRPFQSVNYVTSHDGFTLHDLVAYTRKRNWANGHDNRDGADDFSANCGWEGNVDTPRDVVGLRKRQVKNFCTLLMLSNGVPMFRMGDEVMQTQNGNNNPYNQDTETTWLNWELRQTNDDIFRFFSRMIAFRKAHPTIGRSHFWRDDVTWYGTRHAPDLSPHSRTLAYGLRGRSQIDCGLYVMINGCDTPTQFGIHEGNAPDWRIVIDTARESPDDIRDEAAAPRLNSAYCEVAARSIVVLVRNGAA